MPPKITPKKLQLPNVSSSKHLGLKAYWNSVQQKNKGNHEGWVTVKWDDIADAYLQVHKQFSGKSSQGYRNALKEISSPDLRADFEKYRERINCSNKQPNSQKARKTESGLNVPDPHYCNKGGNLTYAGWIGVVKSENPDVELTREMADEIFGKFEMAVIDMKSNNRKRKDKKEKLSHMWTGRKDYWRNEEKTSQRKKDDGL